MLENENQDDLEPKFNQHTNLALIEISKWSRVISIIGFAMGAFIVVIMLLSGAAIFEKITTMVNLPIQGLYGALIVTFFILFFVLAAVLYFLYKGSTLLKEGTLKNDSYMIAEGFNFIKKFFAISAVYNAIGLIAYILNLVN